MDDKVGPLIWRILHRHFFGSRFQGKLLNLFCTEMNTPKL